MLSFSSTSVTVHQEKRNRSSVKVASNSSKTHARPAPTPHRSRKKPLVPEPTQEVTQIESVNVSGRTKLATKLSFARPDLASQELASIRAMNDGMNFTSSSMTCSMLTGPDDFGEDGLHGNRRKRELSTNSTNDFLLSIHDKDEPPMDWARSRQLQEAILDDLRQGKRPRLPALKFVLDGVFGKDA